MEVYELLVKCLSYDRQIIDRMELGWFLSNSNASLLWSSNFYISIILLYQQIGRFLKLRRKPQYKLLTQESSHVSYK